MTANITTFGLFFYPIQFKKLSKCMLNYIEKYEDDYSKMDYWFDINACEATEVRYDYKMHHNLLLKKV